MKILICGDRKYTNQGKISDAILVATNGRHKWHVDYIHGDCQGADRLGEAAARGLGVNPVCIRRYPAHWGRFGQAAGPIRNQEMLDKEKPDICLAFHSDISKSKGTLDMIKRANKAGIEVRLYS